MNETIGSAYEFDKVYYFFAYAVLFGFFQGALLAEASDFSVAADSELSAIVEVL